ncbi:MAG: type I-E CRISPR-associated endonuclease Cas1e [Aggregatilineales bacterium]
MSIHDLHILPKVRDGWSYLYVEHAKIEQDNKAIKIIDRDGTTAVPCAALSLLMLGPGTSISHAAVHIIAESGCMVAWTGEQAVRFYAVGMGETRSASNLLRQAELHADPALRLTVVRHMYEMRFPEKLEPTLTLQQIRGKEGVRVRDLYAHWSRETEVEWNGRAYKQNDWNKAEPINRALSAATSCLYGVAHAAIVAGGYSPALGFIHTGKMLSFVYDIADLYKADIAIPVAFQCTAAGEKKLETRVRRMCRDQIRMERMLDRILEDLSALFTTDSSSQERATAFDQHFAIPGGLWDGDGGEVSGGVNYGDEEEE